MRVLVTGASGFLGMRLVPLLAERHNVVVVARRPVDGVETLVCDLARERPALPSRLDAIVHLAQSRRYRDWPEGAADIYALNVDVAFWLLEHARRGGASHFVLASTGAVYASAQAPLSENGALGPQGFYPRSKLAAEILADGYANELVTAVLRPFALYGANQRDMMIASIAERVQRGEEIAVRGDPGLRMNPIHVDDAARAFAAALELEGSGTFNVAGNDVISLKALVELLAELANVEPRIRHDEGMSASLVGDTTRMRMVLGVTPRVSLREGLASVVSAARAP